MMIQWRIQEFPERGINPKGESNLLFGKYFAKNSMKIKEIGPRERHKRRWHPLPLDPPMKSLKTRTHSSRYRLLVLTVPASRATRCQYWWGRDRVLK